MAHHKHLHASALRRSPIGTLRCSFPEADVRSHVQQIERMDYRFSDDAVIEGTSAFGFNQ